MPKPRRKYDYSSLIKKLVKELQRNPHGLTSREIGRQLGFQGGVFSYGPFARLVIRKANALLVEHGYSIQWSPEHQAYLLGKNGTLLQSSIRHKKRHVTTRIMTIKSDLLSVRNAYAQDSEEWQKANTAITTADFLVNIIKTI